MEQNQLPPPFAVRTHTRRALRIVLFAGFACAAVCVSSRSNPKVAFASTPPPVLSLAATPSSSVSNSFYVGQRFILGLSGAPANASFTICAVFPSRIQSCTPNWGATDATGAWTQSGVWVASTTATGTWKEWVQFPAQNVSSNDINFTMASSGPSAPPPTVGSTPPPPPPASSTAAITGIQGFNPANGAYADGVVFPGDYMILYGDFGASGNTVAINGRVPPAADVTYQGLTGGASSSEQDQINVSLSTSTQNPNVVLSWLNAGSSNAATVTTPAGATTAPAPFSYGAPTPPPPPPRPIVPPAILPPANGLTAMIFNGIAFSPVGSGWRESLASQNPVENVSLSVSAASSLVAPGQPYVLGVWCDSAAASLPPDSTATGVYNRVFVAEPPCSYEQPGDYTLTVELGSPDLAAGSNLAQASFPVTVGNAPAAPSALPKTPRAPVPPAGYFPVTVLVTSPSLYVRSAPNTGAPLAGSGTLNAGDAFIAVNEVAGESVNGNDLWWVSSKGNYIWSGGTEAEGSGTTTTTPPVVTPPATLGIGIQTVTFEGTPYSVNYFYIPDGEVRATFTYNGQAYAEQNQQVADFNSDKAGTEGIAGLTAASVPAGSPLAGLAQQIYASGPEPKNMVPGFTFATPLHTPAGALFAVGEYALSLAGNGTWYYVFLTTNAAGSITAVHGSGLDLYIAGNYVFLISGSGSYLLDSYPTRNGGLPYQDTLSLTNASIISDSSGNPSAITGRFALSASGQNIAATAPVTLTLGSGGANQSLNPSALQIINFNNPTAGEPSFVVINDGYLLNVVNSGGAAAYQYVIANNLSGASVMSVSSGGYEVLTANGSVIAAFDANGNIAQKVISSPPATISASQLQAEIMNAYATSASSLTNIANLATQAGYLVYENQDDSSIIIRDPITLAVVAAINQASD